ncbi:MAG: thioredoxin peroxidase [Alphaproteobacteria bacterium 16-39-46]|nr:MAG: thioredoxin peroxidase [Alphaproteobacteria bacterium 16-39-46]OZA43053.1 MAG: thioredoxin peroxidase [Alphaproteobacteria bacterium 17-39-52]HQS84122.1 peroxiredoxin [Alphaproteobacteria bacterium]HQS93836.1 peroxiredoxin [Alphaproteobacteria bacterium]
MSVLVGQPAPLFKAQSVSSGTFKEISLEDYRGKYVILFFYPLDFTFVCPTELHAFQDHLEAFKKRNAVVLGCSVDSHFSHKAWLDTPKEKGGIEGVTYPIISDLGGKIAEQYDVLHKDGIAYRGLFLIDKEGIVRHQVVNDLPLGRNVLEALRMLEALQHVEQHGEVCPANWQNDKAALKATPEGVSDYFRQNKS